MQEILLFTGLIAAVGYLAYHFRPKPNKSDCSSNCKCESDASLKTNIES